MRRRTTPDTERGLWRLNGDESLRRLERDFDTYRDVVTGAALVRAQVRSGRQLESALDDLFYRLEHLVVGWRSNLRCVNEVALGFPDDLFTHKAEWYGDYLVVGEPDGSLRLWNPKNFEAANISTFGTIFNAQDIPTGSLGVEVGTLIPSLEYSIIEINGSGSPANTDDFNRANLMTGAALCDEPLSKWSNWLALRASEAVNARDQCGPAYASWLGIVFPFGSQLLQVHAFGTQVGAQEVRIAKQDVSVLDTALAVLDRQLPGYFHTQRERTPLS